MPANPLAGWCFDIAFDPREEDVRWTMIFFPTGGYCPDHWEGNQYDGIEAIFHAAGVSCDEIMEDCFRLPDKEAAKRLMFAAVDAGLFPFAFDTHGEPDGTSIFASGDGAVFAAGCRRSG